MSDTVDKIKVSLYWQTVIRIGWEILRFVISIIVARILDPKDFGIIGIASIIVFYTNSLSELGLGNALIQRKSISRNHIDSMFTVNLIISLFITISTYVLSPWISEFFKMPELTAVLKAMSLIFVFSSFSQIPNTLLKRKLDFRLATIAQFLKGGVNIAISLSMALTGFGYWALVVGFIGCELFYAVYLMIVTRYLPRFMIDTEALKSLLNFGVWSFIMAQVGILNEYLHKVIIGKILGSTQLGYYDKAVSIAFMPVDSISMKINSVMFSAFSRYQDDPDELCNYLMKISAISSFVCFPFLIGIALVAPSFVALLLGEKWMTIIIPMQILSFGFTFRVLFGLFDSLNISAGDYRKHIIVRILIMAVFAVAYVVFAHKGIVAVSVMLAVNNACSLFSSFVVAKKRLEALSYTAYARAIVPAVGSNILMFLGVTAATRYFIPQDLLICLVFQVLIGMCIYFICFLMIQHAAIRSLREDVFSFIRKKGEGLWARKA